MTARSAQPSRRQVGWLVLAGGLFGFELSLWAAALFLTTITNATLMSNMTPVAAALFGWFLFRERLAKAAVAGGLMALVGAFALAIGRAQTGAGPASAEAGWLGDGLGLMSALGYAGYLLIVRSLGTGVFGLMFWASLRPPFTPAEPCDGRGLLPQTLEGGPAGRWQTQLAGRAYRLRRRPSADCRLHHFV